VAAEQLAGAPEVVEQRELSRRVIPLAGVVARRPRGEGRLQQIVQPSHADLSGRFAGPDARKPSLAARALEHQRLVVDNEREFVVGHARIAHQRSAYEIGV